MTSAVAIDDLRARVLAATARSHDVIDRSKRLQTAVRRNLVWAQGACMDARVTCDHCAAQRHVSIEGFRVDGLVDGQPVTAVLVDGRLDCPIELRTRAEIVVALGETFGGDGLPCVRASLTDDPTAMLLTVLRAMSLVRHIAIDSGPPPPDDLARERTYDIACSASLGRAPSASLRRVQTFMLMTIPMISRISSCDKCSASPSCRAPKLSATVVSAMRVIASV